jgi:hypothetical protein
MSAIIQFEHIESALQALPIQSRTMIQLLLLQYLDVTQEEIDYMATDQPDSRFMAGNQPAGKTISLEAVLDVSSRTNQYKSYYRQKRERPGLHVKFLKQALSIIDRTLQIAERVLVSDFNTEEETIKAAQAQAPTILLRQDTRKLQRAWENEELPLKDYQTQRLLLEYQALLRRRGIFRRRLKLAQQDFLNSGNLPLKDHEIGHIWGIPLGSLRARKIKALQQFLTLLQEKHENSSLPNGTSQPVDLWRETFNILAQRPIEQSVVEYDGLEKTEEVLLEKLRAFFMGAMSEPEESKFWTSITKVNDTEFSGAWRSHARSILAFQRLQALLNDMDLSEEALEEDLLARITPKLPDDQLATPEAEEKLVELGEEGLGVLSAFAGEQDDKRRG